MGQKETALAVIGLPLKTGLPGDEFAEERRSRRIARAMVGAQPVRGLCTPESLSAVAPGQEIKNLMKKGRGEGMEMPVDLWIKLNDVEIREKADELSSLMLEYDSIEEEKRAATKEFNDDLKELRAKMRAISKAIRNGASNVLLLAKSVAVDLRAERLYLISRPESGC